MNPFNEIKKIARLEAECNEHKSNAMAAEYDLSECMNIAIPELQQELSLNHEWWENWAVYLKAWCDLLGLDWATYKMPMIQAKIEAIVAERDELRDALELAVKALESDGKYSWISIRPEYREALLTRLRELL